MKIAIAADHGGYELKQQLIANYRGAEFVDLGTDSCQSTDYPDFAKKMCKIILSKTVDLGVLICGTGIGISIAANRYKGIRAALLYNDEVAKLAKEHNNANVLVFGGRTMNLAEVIKRMDIFINAKFAGDRHQRRIDKIDNME